MKTRSAFTLIEMIVVIAVITVLIGLLLPAAHRVRESCNRMKCTDNLRQIGLAFQSYHDRWSSLPPGYVSKVAPDNSDLGPGWSWAARLLDDVELGNVQQQIHFDKDIRDPVNVDARGKMLPVFVCPSESIHVPVFVVDAQGKPLVEIARASYTAMNGVLDVAKHAGDNNGAFLRNEVLRMADIKDGLSKTLFVGERAATLADATWTGAAAGGVVPALRHADRAEQLAHAQSSAALVLSHGSRSVLPNDPEVLDAAGTSSNHSGGVNFLFGDGSVHMLGKKIDGAVYEALLTRAGGEAVRGGEY
jgi:prepilin-type N-terminal cleavage/methylation domain-containing protein/prepilin-type processing-associated H-X9-DG protein